MCETSREEFGHGSKTCSLLFHTLNDFLQDQLTN
jgi:hypothetical protein